MKTIFASQRAATTALALITIALLGLTACQQDGATSPIASLDDLATAAVVSGTSLNTSDAQSANLDASDTESCFSSGMNLLALAGGSETRPEAVLEINRRLISRTGTQTGGEATGRFDSSLGVTGVSVAILGTTYQFVQPPLRGRNGGGQPNGGQQGGQRPARITSTIFVFPAPPSTTATTAPSLITLNDANATATFTVSGYALADNTLDIPGTIAFTSVKSGDVVSRSAATTVRWSVAGTFTNGVVTLHNVLDSAALAGKSRREVEQIRRNLPKPITKQLQAGATSVEFTAAELTALQSGTAELSIGIVNAKRTNSDKAILIAHSRTGLRLSLQ